MGGPGSGRKTSGHAVQISKINGVITKIGASHRTVKAGKRAKLHHRKSPNPEGFKNPGGLKFHKKDVAYRVHLSY